MTVAPAPAPPAWARPLVVGIVVAVLGHAMIDRRGSAVYLVAGGVAVVYLVLDRVLRRVLPDALAAKRVLQILSALALSVTTTAGLLDVQMRLAPLTAWTPAVSASLAIEIGVTVASLLTALRVQLAMPALLLHHVLLLLACDSAARNRFGTGAIVAALFQESTNIGWYLHWVLNSPETSYHARWPRLFNLNALWTIGWYAVGRFGISLPILVYLLWQTPRDASWTYVGLYTVGLLALTYMNAQNFVKLARSYPRCPSSWMHRAPATVAVAATSTQ